MQHFETIVIGLGAMGSAALYQLAKRGNKVLGIDRYNPPHPYGSSHGDSRIVRQAIGEGQEYVPFALRSYELWREIEKDTGLELLTVTGGLTLESRSHSAFMHGRADFLERAIRCAAKFGIRHEILEANEIRKRFPQFAVTDERAYYEYETGFVRPERCIETQLELARKHGADVHAEEIVRALESRASGVIVETDRDSYSAEKVILSAGPWIARFLPPQYGNLFKDYRQIMYWFEIQPEHQAMFRAPGFPIFIWIFGTGSEFGFYGFPSLDGRTIKVATEQFTQTTDPDQLQRVVGSAEKKSIYRDYIRARVPGISDCCMKAAVCAYTQTPDSHFVIDFLPDDRRILIASPCSGHGFKHSAAIGEALAELVVENKSKLDIRRFGLDRFEAPGS